MASGLFNEFASTSKAAWVKQVEKELRISFDTVSQREISEDAFIEPYYTADEVNQQAVLDIHDAQRKTAGWLNAIEIPELAVEAPEKQLLPFSLDGVGAIFLPADEILFQQLQRQAEIEKTDLKQVPVYWSGVWKNNAGISTLIELQQPVIGGIADDPLASFVKSGEDPLATMHRIADCFERFSGLENFRLMMISSAYPHELGADPVQELAYLTAGMVYYLHHFTDLGITPNEVMRRLFFSVPVGTEYMTEIAKLRALRTLYNRIARSYNCAITTDHCMIRATTSAFYHSTIATEENMLRNTSAAMSAVIGGCDLLTVRPHSSSDALLAPRIARNVSLILSEESHLGFNPDPAAGSYFIDQLTSTLVEHAWGLFLKMEKNGGFVEAWKSGFTPSLFENGWQKQIAGARAGRVMVGVNRYAKETLQTPAKGSKRSIEQSLNIAENFSKTDQI